MPVRLRPHPGPSAGRAVRARVGRVCVLAEGRLASVLARCLCPGAHASHRAELYFHVSV